LVEAAAPEDEDIQLEQTQERQTQQMVERLLDIQAEVAVAAHCIHSSDSSSHSTVEHSWHRNVLDEAVGPEEHQDDPAVEERKAMLPQLRLPQQLPLWLPFVWMILLAASFLLVAD
jgi:phosphoribosylaminoimidazole carboxylase (NCAIR synthetase)